MGLRGAQRLHQADALVRRPIGAAVTFLHGVAQPEVERIDAQFLGKLVHDRLGGKGGVGAPRRAVSSRLGPVYHDVIAVDLEVI